MKEQEGKKVEHEKSPSLYEVEVLNASCCQSNADTDTLEDN